MKTLVHELAKGRRWFTTSNLNQINRDKSTSIAQSSRGIKCRLLRRKSLISPNSPQTQTREFANPQPNRRPGGFWAFAVRELSLALGSAAVSCWSHLISGSDTADHVFTPALNTALITPKRPQNTGDHARTRLFCFPRVRSAAQASDRGRSRDRSASADAYLQEFVDLAGPRNADCRPSIFYIFPT